MQWIDQITREIKNNKSISQNIKRLPEVFKIQHFIFFCNIKRQKTSDGFICAEIIQTKSTFSFFFYQLLIKPYWVLALHFLHLNMYLPLQFFRLSCRHLLSLSAPYIECNYANCHPPKSECAMHNMIYLRFLFTPSKAVLSRSKNKARLLKSRPLCI